MLPCTIEDGRPVVIYDIETDHQHATYAQLRMVAVQYGLAGTPELVETAPQRERFRKALADPDTFKVAFNNINFDDIVLRRHGFRVHPQNRHDCFLMAKTVLPTLPGYGLKFLAWLFFCDWHEPERRLNEWAKRHRCVKWDAPKEILAPYCCHDVTQTVNVFQLLWPVVQRPQHWRPYVELELAMGEVLHEMCLVGGEHVDLDQCNHVHSKLMEEKAKWTKEARTITEETVTNPNSNKQVAYWLKHFENVELEVSDKGNLLVRKSDLLALLDLDNPQNDKSRLARCVFEIRAIDKQLGYIENFINAGGYHLFNYGRLGRAHYYLSNIRKRGKAVESAGVIRVDAPTAPGQLVKVYKSYSLSGARTRRFTSSSHFGINWQNIDKTAKGALMVPPGWLGVWIDSTQIENVVHIWASDDKERRMAYEADPNWNEYVWLCNRILGGNRTRKELDKITSPVNPAWSIYKQYKTCKLALNFGMGVRKFAATTGATTVAAASTFADVHRACTAIKKLQRTIERDIREKGFVSDPFGHIYSGDPKKAYKIVAYLVQGCGTGSVPKAMAVANYATLRKLDRPAGTRGGHCEPDAWRAVDCYGVATGTTHDEFSCRLSLSLPDAVLVGTLRELLCNMEEKFSSRFDGIPLRAKLSLSIKSAADAVELDHRAPDFDRRVWREFIQPGRERLKFVTLQKHEKSI